MSAHTARDGPIAADSPPTGSASAGTAPEGGSGASRTGGGHGRHGLPPPSTLLVFEAAARHRSFKLAAAELGVTPGAVSHQVKALEHELGVPLFLRRHRGVEPTAAGTALAGEIGSGYAALARLLADIRAEHGRRAVTVAATTAVSSLWLTPRLTSFWKAYPDIAVTQHVSDTPGDALVPIDLRVAYGEPEGAVELFRDTLVPVCSPAFAALHPAPSLAELATLPLMHVEASASGWTSWHEWFAALGHAGEIAVGRRVNNYVIALQCARDDVGVVLGWRRLVAPLLERGVLVPLGTHSLPAPLAFHVTHDTEADLAPGTRRLRDWLVASVDGSAATNE